MKLHELHAMRVFSLGLGHMCGSDESDILADASVDRQLLLMTHMCAATLQTCWHICIILGGHCVWFLTWYQCDNRGID